jgi:hypothetical protein
VIFQRAKIDDDFLFFLFLYFIYLKKMIDAQAEKILLRPQPSYQLIVVIYLLLHFARLKIHSRESVTDGQKERAQKHNIPSFLLLLF